MEWFDKDTRVEGWKLFLKTIFYPLGVWGILLVVLFLGFMLTTYFKNSYIIESMISFLPFYVNYKMGIIGTLGTLVLTVIISSYGDTKGDIKSSYDYARGFAYQQYAKWITHFLGITWFMDFIYRVWVRIDISEIKKEHQIFLSWWDTSNHGKFFGKTPDIFESIINKDNIPTWIFIFLSWFVLSVSYQLKNKMFNLYQSIHGIYKNIYSLEQKNKESYRIAQNIISIKEEGSYKNNYEKHLYSYVSDLFPGEKSGKYYTGYLGLTKDYTWGIPRFVSPNIIIFLLQSGVSIMLLRLLFGYNFNFNISSFVYITIINTAFSVSIAFYGFYVRDIPVNSNFRRSIKFYAKGFPVIMLAFVGSGLNFTLSALGFYVKDDVKDPDDSIFTAFFLTDVLIFAIVVIVFYSWIFQMNYIHYIKYCTTLLKAAIGLEIISLYGINRFYDVNLNEIEHNFLNENFNVVIIAKIVYMEEFARKLYRDLAHQSDKDMNMEKDLQSVYRKIRMDN